MNKFIKNRYTSIVREILERDANGDALIKCSGRNFKLSVQDMQEHWTAIDGCPVCNDSKRVFNIYTGKTEVCRVCSGIKKREEPEQSTPINLS